MRVFLPTRPSFRRRHALPLLAATLSCGAGASVEAASPTAVVIQPVGEERVLVDHDREACETWDIPDTPTRAFRDFRGDIRLFQTHHRNRASIGPDFARLRHRCAVVFEGDERGEPSSFDNSSWIAATHTLDGRTVYGIVHDEYRGHRHGVCATDQAMECWYNTLTLVVSRNGGDSFEASEPRLVAGLPFRAEAVRGGHAGYFEPTNIVAFDGAFFMMANVVSPPPQVSGNCLLRTDDLADPSAWRVWRNGAFDTKLADPYAGPIEVEAHLCDPIAPGALRWPVTSLTFFEPAETWIATMKGRAKDKDGTERTGIYYATSPDLLKWSGPALLLEAPLMGSACAPARPIAYPALIDPESADRNFQTIGESALLTYVRARPDGCELGPDRDVLMQGVAIRPR